MHHRTLPSAFRMCQHTRRMASQAASLVRAAKPAPPSSHELVDKGTDMRPLLKKLVQLPLPRKEQALAYLSLVNARSTTRQHIMEGADEEVVAAIRSRIKPGPQVLLTYEAVFDLKRSVDNELALLRKQKSEFGLMYTNKEVLHSLEVLEIAYGLLLLRTIGRDGTEQEDVSLGSVRLAPLRAYMEGRHPKPARWWRIHQEDVPLYWDERWGWGSTWEGPLCAWDTFLSEAASWVKSVSTSPALVIQAKVPRPDPHCLQFEAALDDHLVKQLLYPVCCLSYTGELGPDLGFTHEAPPLPAAGHVRLSINVHGSGRTLVPVLAVQRASAPRYNGGKAPAPADEGEEANMGVKELCSYMEAGGLTHGLLCSDVYFWFVKALGEGKGFAISSPLKYNRKHPTVITALAYVVHSAISQSSLPSTPEATSQEQSMGIQGNASQAGLQADETGLHDNTAVATCGYAVVSQQPSSSSPATYSVSDLGLAGTRPLLLGQGNLAACYEGCLNGVPVAVKIPKRSLTRDDSCAEVSLKREVAAFQLLAPLQGKVIPRLVAHGTLARPSGCQAPFLATQSLSHAPPLLKAVKELGLGAGEMRRVAAAAWSALKAVHDLGVAHHSVHEGNLLLEYSREPGGKCTVWLIDLQRAIACEHALSRPAVYDVDTVGFLRLAKGEDFGWYTDSDCDRLRSMLEQMVQGLAEQVTSAEADCDKLRSYIVEQTFDMCYGSFWL